jgi:exonuclease I
MTYCLFVGDYVLQDDKQVVMIDKRRMSHFFFDYRARNFSKPPRHVGTTSFWIHLQDRFNFTKLNTWDLQFKSESDLTFFLMHL